MDTDNLTKTQVHSFNVFYEKDAYEGVRYLLEDLDYKEARVFFDQARFRGVADFEDDNERQLTLKYTNGKYFLSRR